MSEKKKCHKQLENEIADLNDRLDVSMAAKSLLFDKAERMKNDFVKGLCAGVAGSIILVVVLWQLLRYANQ